MSITFGAGSAPSQVTQNLDSLFGLSLAAYHKELVDNIGATNAFFHEVMKAELYEAQDGGAYIQVPLMYALAPMDTYSGYDELSTLPTDGITDAIWEWRQAAAPVAYSMKEVKQNKQKILDLVKSRITQAEMGIQEGFAQMLHWGAANQGGNLYSAYTSLVNGSLGIEPLPRLIRFDPTQTDSPGNIAQGTNTWWRNKTKTSGATTYDGYYLENDNIFNSCSLGAGGKPKIVLLDQNSYEMFVHSVWQHVRYTPQADDAYPFENIVYKGAHFTMDDKVADVYSNAIPTLAQGSGDPGSLTYGSAFYINPAFFKLVHETDSDFTMLKDENGKTFQKPINGDSRVGHISWMGNLTVRNRRKQGVLGKIARTLVTP